MVYITTIFIICRRTPVHPYPLEHGPSTQLQALQGQSVDISGQSRVLPTECGNWFSPRATGVLERLICWLAHGLLHQLDHGHPHGQQWNPPEAHYHVQWKEESHGGSQEEPLGGARHSLCLWQWLRTGWRQQVWVQCPM